MNLNSFLPTVLKNGRASYNITTGDTTPKTGYMVGIDGYEERHECSNILNHVVRDYVVRYSEILSDGETFLGGWLDRPAFEVCLDISMHIPDLQDAIHFAKNNNQVAIYDCRNKTEICII
jgi:hypothetical protein